MHNTFCFIPLHFFTVCHYHRLTKRRKRRKKNQKKNQTDCTGTFTHMTFNRTWTVVFLLIYWSVVFSSVQIQLRYSFDINNPKTNCLFITSNHMCYCLISNIYVYTSLLMVILLIFISFFLSFSYFTFFHSLCPFERRSRRLLIVCTNRVESTSSSQLPSAPENNRNYYNATNNQEYNNPTQFNSYFSVYDEDADDTGDLYRDGEHSNMCLY